MKVCAHILLVFTVFLLMPAYGQDAGATDSSSAARKGVLTDKTPYKADNISISVDGNIIYLKGHAEFKYQDLTLTAHQIKIDNNINMLYANGVLDSTDADGNRYFTGNPVFSQKGQEPMSGETIEYDFTTRRGKIKTGRTKMPPGYYKGENIYKVADSTLLVRNGYFTTCDLPDHPHYYFKSNRMRLKTGDRVVARPIYFYIADIPLAVLPFGVFSNKGGRHSGLIVPSYGESRVGGRILRGLGYYWAPNDFMDATLQTDFYDRIGFTYRGSARYNVRYKLNGSFSGQYLPRDPTTGLNRQRWVLNFRHNQTIDPTLHISGSGRFQSDKDFQRDVSPSLEDRLNQNITSTLAISKSFKGTKNSMNLSMTRTQNLQSNESDYVFPSMTFNHRQSNLFESISGKKLGTQRGWYQNIMFAYNSRLLYSGSHKMSITQVDTSKLDTSFTDTQKFGLKHTFSLNAPQKIFKYINIRPSINFDEVWVDEIAVGTIDPQSNKLVTSTKKGFAARHTFNTAVALSTKLYGMFEPHIGSLRAIRHTLTPSVSFSYTPDFSTANYGYFNEVLDTTGQVVLVDKFSRSPFGATSRSKSKRMNLSLDNLFQTKTIDAKGNEKKQDLFKANFRTSYNLNATSFQWGRLTSSYTLNAFGKSFSATAVHSLYAIGADGKEDGNTFFFEKGAWLPRLTAFNTNFSFTLNNQTFGKKEKAADESKVLSTGTEDSLLTGNNLFGRTDNTRDREREELRRVKRPWSVAFSFNYTLNRNDPKNTIQRLNSTVNAQIRITKNWKLGWRVNLDLIDKKLAYQTLNIYRDLHCWEMSFNWQPQQGYYSFQINIKDPMLKDIKLTKHPTRSRFVTY